MVWRTIIFSPKSTTNPDTTIPLEALGVVQTYDKRTLKALRFHHSSIQHTHIQIQPGKTLSFIAGARTGAHTSIFKFQSDQKSFLKKITQYNFYLPPYKTKIGCYPM